MPTKLQRVAYAKELIKSISSYGRRFFYNEKFDRIAQFEIDSRGKIWFTDDYTGIRIYTHYKGRWRKFSHGGTLRNLVEMIRNYITTGETIDIWFIGCDRGNLSNGNVWGYSDESIKALRFEVAKSPVLHDDVI